MSDITIVGLGIMGLIIYLWLLSASADLSVHFTGDIWAGVSILMLLTGAVLAYVGTLK